MSRFWIVLVALAAAPSNALGQEANSSEIEALRAEVNELKELVRELSAQTKELCERLRQVEGVAVPIGGNQRTEQRIEIRPDSRQYRLRFPASIERAMLMDPASIRMLREQHLLRRGIIDEPKAKRPIPLMRGLK